MSSKVISYFCSTIGRKQLVAISGLVWTLFILGHMAGNLLIFAGPQAYNTYGHFIVTNKPLLLGTEAVLILALITHVTMTIWLTRDNRRARPQAYTVSPKGEKAGSLASRTMIFHGTIILVFIITHLITFKFGTHYSVNYDGVEMRDLHRLMVDVFKEPGYVVWYVISLLLLFTHLSHGMTSVFQTWGLNHPQYNTAITRFGYAYAVIVTLGFVSQPLYIFLQG
jgi:succinate dehydrogenase / fumarate reductase cytochrome b subunit